MPSDPIQHLRELMAKATPRPWFVDESGDLRDGDHRLIHGRDAYYPTEIDDDDLTAVVAAINAIPALLAVAEAMRELERHELGKAANDIVSNALAKLDEVK